MSIRLTGTVYPVPGCTCASIRRRAEGQERSSFRGGCDKWEFATNRRSGIGEVHHSSPQSGWPNKLRHRRANLLQAAWFGQMSLMLPPAKALLIKHAHVTGQDEHFERWVRVA